MTADQAQIKATILRELARIAPEAELATLAPDVDFRDQLDIDSFDFLNLIIRLHEALNVDVPEADYPKLATLDGAIVYLETALGDASRPRPGQSD
ncbi:MAG: acyl carrier protein [Candidatus Sericytochromatia bacterium]